MGRQIFVLQYNPPYTLPTFRRNEIFVRVKGGKEGAEVKEEMKMEKEEKIVEAKEEVEAEPIR